MTFPLVTVITPTYNRAELLKETIESVLAQDYPHIEYIVLDDGSNDETRQMLDQYSGRLTWYHHPNMGETLTVNRGLDMARGEFVCILSSDDPMLPGTVRAGVTALLENPQAVVAYPDWIVIDDDGLIIDEVRRPDFSFEHMVRWHDCLPGPSTFFRRNLLEAVKGRDPLFRYTGDFEFWLRAALEGPFVRIPQLYGCFREHGGSTTISSLNPHRAYEHVLLVEKFFALELPSTLRKLRADAFSSAYFTAGYVVGSDHRERLRFFYHCLTSSTWRFLWKQKHRLPVMLILLLDKVPGVAKAHRYLIRRGQRSPRKGWHYSLVASDFT